MDGMVVKAFVTMLMIVGLMFGLLVVVRKYLFAKPGLADENMKVLSTISLQPKKAIYLVKIFDKDLASLDEEQRKSAPSS